MMHSPVDAEAEEVSPVAAVVAAGAFPAAVVVEVFPVAVAEAFPAAGDTLAAVPPRAAASRPVRDKDRPGLAQ